MREVGNIAFTLAAMVSWAIAGFQIAKIFDSRDKTGKVDVKHRRKTLTWSGVGVAFAILAYLLR